MIETILPEVVVVEEVTAPLLDVERFPQEEAHVAQAVEERQEEYASSRACARRALGRLQVPAAPIPTGPRGEPLWPRGVVGSITHCRGYRGCAVARSADILAVGIDAEPHAALPEGVLGEVAFGEELDMLKRLTGAEPGVFWDRLLFSAKEAVYKAWFPLTHRWLGFEEAALSIEPDANTFTAALLVKGPTGPGGELRALAGRWTARDGLLFTAIVLARRPVDRHARTWPVGR